MFVFGHKVSVNVEVAQLVNNNVQSGYEDAEDDISVFEILIEDFETKFSFLDIDNDNSDEVKLLPGNGDESHIIAESSEDTEFTDEFY